MDIFQIIKDEIDHLLNLDFFDTWLKENQDRASKKEHSWVTVNNSFLKRKPNGTIKGSEYLALKYSELDQKKVTEVYLSDQNQNQDFLLKTPSEDPKYTLLTTQIIESYCDNFGFASFILIGELQPISPCEHVVEQMTIRVDGKFPDNENFTFVSPIELHLKDLPTGVPQIQ